MTDILDSLLSDLNEIKADLDNIHKTLTLDDLDEVPQPVEQSPRGKRPKKKFLCPSCNTKLTYIADQSRRKCEKCAYASKIMSSEAGDSLQSYNNISESSVLARVQGTGILKAGINRQVLQSSDTKKYRQSKILEQVIHDLGNSSLSIPRIYLEVAVHKYCQISQLSSVRLVFRGDGLRSMLAGFISFVCIDNDMSVSNEDLAKAFAISEKAITRARRIIYSLNERGLTDVVSHHRKLDIYLKKACSSLKIPDEYCTFLIALIKRAEDKNLHLIESTVEKTRCAGAICMLLGCVKSLYDRISLTKVEKKCKVTIPTFMKYYDLLMQHKPALKKVFKAHKIPMPKKWNTRD